MITRRLICKLDDSEVLMRGQQLAQAEYDYSDTERNRKATADHFKRSLDVIDGRITELSSAIKSREEIRDVECVIQDNHALLKHEVVRLDTGEIVEQYDFTEKERQGTLL